MATAEDLLPRDNDENKTSELLTIQFGASTYEDIPQDRTEQTERVIVTVATPVFRGKGKWKVVYQKNIISVSITDEVFLQKAASTVYRFGAGISWMLI